jgi:hypothetical protein
MEICCAMFSTLSLVIGLDFSWHESICLWEIRAVFIDSYKRLVRWDSRQRQSSVLMDFCSFAGERTKADWNFLYCSYNSHDYK